jgi:RNA polymerase sigma factor (sigma-70 family)
MGMMGEDDNFDLLIHRAAEGSEEAAWQLVEQYGEAIRRAVRRALDSRLRCKFDSLDFVQLVWSSFFRARGRIDRFSRPEDLVAFLISLARNKVGMEARRLQTDKRNVNRELAWNESLEDQAERPDGRVAPIDVAIAREQWDRLFSDQSAQNQAILELRKQGLSCAETAAELGISERRVRGFLQRLFQEKLK